MWRRQETNSESFPRIFHPDAGDQEDYQQWESFPLSIFIAHLPPGGTIRYLLMELEWPFGKSGNDFELILDTTNYHDSLLVANVQDGDDDPLETIDTQIRDSAMDVAIKATVYKENATKNIGGIYILW